jgi:hypothetical protein
MAAFVTLCEAYMGIEPHFNLWNYFCAQLQQGSDVKAAVLGSVDMFVQSGHDIDPNLPLAMLNPPVGWRKAWFLLRNDIDALLPVFTGSCPIPLSNWGYEVAQMGLHRLQPLLEDVRGLLRKGLMGAEILQIFFGHRVQLLR